MFILSIFNIKLLRNWLYQRTAKDPKFGAYIPLWSTKKIFSEIHPRQCGVVCMKKTLRGRSHGRSTSADTEL